MELMVQLFVDADQIGVSPAALF